MTQGRQSAGTIKTPETRSDLEALQVRREELRGQLRSLEDRRTQLSAQHSVTEQSQRGQLAQRIAALDERIPRVERELLQLDEAISNSVGKFVSVEPTPLPAPVPPPEWQLQPGGVPVTLEPSFFPPSLGPDVARLMVIEAAGFVIIGFVAWRYTLRWMEQRLMGKGSNAGEVLKLQQSVDSIAVEVERISENQRYVTKLLGEKALDSGASKD